VLGLNTELSAKAFQPFSWRLQLAFKYQALALIVFFAVIFSVHPAFFTERHTLQTTSVFDDVGTHELSPMLVMLFKAHVAIESIGHFDKFWCFDAPSSKMKKHFNFLLR